MNHKTRIVTLFVSIAAAASGYIAFAGPLDPPPGPVAPTYKTLTEVEPRIAVNSTNTPGDADSLFKIAQPGSYYLTGNIRGFPGKHGIEIAASGVTLDLNGFDLVGVPKMGVVDGVSVTVAGLTNIAVVNGSVRNWGDEGVDLGTFIATNCRVANLLVSGNAGDGISTGDSCTVSNCSAFDNTGIGINARGGCTVSNCSAYLNTGHGIKVVLGCTISNSSTFQNTGNGISAGGGSTVVNCSAESNTLDGIVCLAHSVIRGNTCTSNGNGGVGAGIRIISGDNRIEGNNCTNNDRGIGVDSGGNLIIKNSCSANNTNWDVVAGNVILVVNATTAGAVGGNSGGAAPGSTDPNANFSY